MHDDFDLEGLSKQEAQRYVASFIESLVLARRQRIEREQEYETWKSRTRLAADKGEPELARQALARAEELYAVVTQLRREEHELDFKVTELKRRLVGVERQPELSIDADALLEQLEAVVGPDRETNEAIARTEAELALEELRRKMAAEEGKPNGTA